MIAKACLYDKSVPEPMLTNEIPATDKHGTANLAGLFKPGEGTAAEFFFLKLEAIAAFMLMGGRKYLVAERGELGPKFVITSKYELCLVYARHNPKIAKARTVVQVCDVTLGSI